MCVCVCVCVCVSVCVCPHMVNHVYSIECACLPPPTPLDVLMPSVHSWTPPTDANDQRTAGALSDDHLQL